LGDSRGKLQQPFEPFPCRGRLMDRPAPVGPQIQPRSALTPPRSPAPIRDPPGFPRPGGSVFSDNPGWRRCVAVNLFHSRATNDQQQVDKTGGIQPRSALTPPDPLRRSDPPGFPRPGGSVFLGCGRQRSLSARPALTALIGLSSFRKPSEARLSGIHNPGANGAERIWVMDSGLADFVRAPE